ncbi:helicase HerA-like domain-containing protein [Aestuariimicrobium kwangyangense]|uniref:helicase HerA-like domain-containing protein n=1 Tax=Aestuariimicrobium kwangyangense TaxID=396389 RepID=UPI0009FD9830|nr:helicase HerA-like domain-containing protein [Aestuariimicrobium kwangyangense]
MSDPAADPATQNPSAQSPSAQSPSTQSPSTQTSSAQTSVITKGYTFDEPSIELGVLVQDDVPVPGAKIRIPLSMLNRHGLVAGATGTGKTKTLQLMAEQVSAAGGPGFAADIKGDLSGLASPGQPSPKLLERTQKIGQDWQPSAAPVEFYALGGEGIGVPLRATMSSFGPILLSKVLELNDTQESTLGLVFHYADQAGLPLLDLSDLRAVLTHLTSDEGKQELKNLGGVSASTAGVILRSLITLSDQGADAFFGEPEFDTADLLHVTADGRGVISLLELPNLQSRPAIFSTFLMWLLADLFHDLPEVGDVEKPKLVFFFDEAHLLFDGASKAFLDAIAQTVRLIRSKGVGVFFVTQTPKDVPDDVLAQLGSRVQHQLRAHTPNDAKALKQTVQTFPTSDYDLAQVLQQLGIGEAIVTVMDPDGAPTPVAWTRMRAPQTLMAPTPEDAMRSGVAQSQMQAKYGQPIDRDSAREILARKLEQGAADARAEQGRAQQDTPQRDRYDQTQQDGYDQPQPRPERSSTRTTRQQKSAVENVMTNPVVKSFIRTAGNEIIRSIFGTARRRR